MQMRSCDSKLPYVLKTTIDPIATVRSLSSLVNNNYNIGNGGGDGVIIQSFPLKHACKRSTANKV